jgi:hypothetical protein
MMDELELLKKDWQKKEEHLPKLSYSEIHTMIWKKSSSIVKWIVIISILEFTLPHLLYLIPGSADSLEIYEKLGIKNISMVLWGLGYGITFYFIYLFYKRYKEISILDNAKDLMKKIIRTRKTVKYYVIYSLSFLFLTCVVLLFGMYLNNDLAEIFQGDSPDLQITPEKFRSILLWTMAIGSVLIILVMGVIYFLLYGLLLRKLNKNYKELKRLEI